MQTSNLQKTEVMSTTGLFNNCSNPLAINRQVKMMKGERASNKWLVLDPEEKEDHAGDAFTANPSDDIPRNKLVEKLARGI